MDTLRFVDLEEARAARGVRLLAASLLPSPWTEAAKGLFHVTQIPVLCVRFRRGDAAQALWSGVDNVPAVFFDDEPPRTGWAEILALAQRLAQSTAVAAPADGTAVHALVPDDAGARADLFGLAHALCGEDGLGWCTRLIMIDGSLTTDGARSFPLPVAQRLAASYGYTPAGVVRARPRVLEVLALIARRLAASQAAGHSYLMGPRLTALDIYLATFLTPIVGVSSADCPALVPAVRAAFDYLGQQVGDGVPPALIEHRRRIYRDHLPWPIIL